MKVTHSQPPKVFSPVTLTFETEAELKEFVEKQRNFFASESGLPLNSWIELRNTLYGTRGS